MIEKKEKKYNKIIDYDGIELKDHRERVKNDDKMNFLCKLDTKMNLKMIVCTVSHFQLRNSYTTRFSLSCKEFMFLIPCVLEKQDDDNDGCFMQIQEVST